MLSKLLRGNDKPDPAGQVRRIAKVRETSPAANMRLVEATGKAPTTLRAPGAVAEGAEQAAPAGLVGNVRRIGTLAEVGHWRAVVPGLVSEADQDKCVVLDREYSSVLILATPEFYRSGGHGVLVNKIRAKTLSIEAESVTHAEVIAAAMSDGQRRGVANLVVKDDDRNMALYEDLLRGAFNLRASDIHFEIEDGGRSRVMLRRYGRMRAWKEFDTTILLDAVAAGYNGKTKAGTASGASWSRDRALSTITEHTFGSTSVLGRFSTYPTVSGLDVVVRLLENDANGKVASLYALGYAPSQIEGQLKVALEKNSGFLAIVGSTNSGKSTTLKTLMNEIPHKDELKRASVEDPVEYRQPGVRQISVQRGVDDDDSEVKRKFLSALRQLLRLDPDVVMIGEIRDQQTGEMASEMVQTGHRVLTTVHGDGCVDAMARLTGRLINVPAEIMSSGKFLSAIMYQKLLPVLCPHCKVPARNVMSAKALAVIAERFQLDTSTMCCASGAGCANCQVDGIESDGTMGLTVAAEIFMPNAETMKLIRVCNWVGIETAWRKTRRTGFADPDMTGKTAFEHGLFKASMGLVDPRDIEREFESFASYRIVEGNPQ